MAWGTPKIGTSVIDATGNFDLIEPAGVAQGDLMVACIAMRGNAVVTPPSGWVAAATQQSSGDTDTTDGIASAAMFYIVRGASAPALTCTRTAGDVAYAKVLSYSGVSISAPYDTGSSNTQASPGATPTTATFNTATANELIVAFVAYGDQYTVSAFDAATDPATASGATDTTTAPTAGTWIERFDANSNTGADTGIGIADSIRSTAGATGTIQATVSSASGRNVMMAAAFKMEVSPTVVLNSPADAGTTSDTTPTLDFTGTDENGDSIEYQVQVDTVNTFDGTPSGFDLKYVDLYLIKSGSPTDNLLVDICSGSFSGSVLGTSDAIAASGVSLGFNRFTFTTPIALSASAKYYIVLRRSGARDAANYILWFYSTSSSYSGGGKAANGSGSWAAESSTDDARFIVYDTSIVAQVTQGTGGTTNAAFAPLGATGSSQECGQSFTVATVGPLINALSLTDAGFVNPDTGGDTHPFNSGENIQYTVQSDLAPGTYYWRVRGIDPAGSNTYGAWSSPTRSFTINSPGGAIGGSMMGVCPFI